MLSHKRYEEEDRARMEFFVYFVIVVLMFLTAIVTFMLSRSFTCG